MILTGPIVEVAEVEEEDEERSAISVTESSLSEQEYQEFLTGTVDEEENPSPQVQESQGDPPQDASKGDDIVHESKEETDNKEDTNPSVASHEGDEESNKTTPTNPESEAKESSEKVEDTPTVPPRDAAEDPSLTSANKEESKPSPHTGSVFERRLVTASRYGRSASISAMRRLVNSLHHDSYT